jgi:hypothetical protein
MATETEAGGRGYIAVIGDIRKSRRALERAALQRVLENALVGVNGRFKSELAAGFVVTLGDEFQGVLLRPSALMDVLVALDEALDGAAVRYGVGWGTLSTEVKEHALGMDGPCFHLAREALAAGKRDDRWVTVAGFGDDDVLNGTLWLVGAARWQRTDIQRQTVAMARESHTQKAVAEARGVSLTTVSKALKSALHEPVLAAEGAASEILSRYDGTSPAAGADAEVNR